MASFLRLFPSLGEVDHININCIFLLSTVPFPEEKKITTITKKKITKKKGNMLIYISI